MADDIEIYATGNWPTAPPTVQVGHGTRAGDAIKIWDLENIIYFTDATVLADTITALGGDHLYMSPAKARQLLGISTSAPFISATGLRDPAATIWIDYPMNRTHHYDPPIGGSWQVNRLPISTTGLPFGFNPLDIPFLDETVDWFVVNGWTSVAAPAFPFPPYRYQWSFSLRQFGGAFLNPDTAPPVPAPISQRRWIDGFEAFNDGAGGSSGMQVSRDASRHIDGYGLAVRNQTNAALLRSYADFVTGAGSRDFWERGYIRVRRLPSSDGPGNTFVRWTNATNGQNNLRITLAGQLELWTTTATLLATVPITVGDWVRLDVIAHYGSGTGTFQLYMNQQLVINLSNIATTGFGQAFDYQSTSLGSPDANIARGLEIDMDDWMNAAPPAALTSMDWLMGSRIMRLRPTSLTANTNWTGSFHNAIGDPFLSTAATISTATPSSLLRMSVDWHDAQLAAVPAATTPSGSAPLFQNGCAAAVMGWACQGPGGTSNLRIRNGAGTIVGSNALAISVQQFYGAMYRPTGMITPDVLGAVTMEWETSVNAGTNLVYLAHMQAEDLGIFGPEDLSPTVSPTPPAPIQYTGIHNSPFPRAPWAQVGGMPQSNVFIAYGVYVGTGTGVLTGPGADLNLPYPPCWIYVRPVTPAGATGIRWWSTLFSSHNGLQCGLTPPWMPQALQDPAFDDAIGNSLMRRAGGSSANNAIGATYQYIAFCDPGQRFTTNGAFATPTVITSAVQLLQLTGFLAEAAFFNVEQMGALVTQDMWYKGVGHTGAFASRMQSAEANNVATFSGAGQLTTESPLHLSGSLSRAQTAYSLWRTNDGVSSGPSQGVVVAIASYVGDGTASRVITLALGGRFPVYAQVTPHNNLSWVRDPSHTGLNSSQADNMVGTSTTAIIGGGINSITVGITLNANGIVYDVFVLPGCSQTGWDNNGGDFCPLNWGGYEDAVPEPYVSAVPVEGEPDLCVNDWDTPRADGLPYVPLMPGSQQDENQ